MYQLPSRTMSVNEQLVASSKEWVQDCMDPGHNVPTIGMVFPSPDEAFEFYKIYSRKLGFGVTRRSSHNFYGIKYDVTFACNKNRKPTSSEKEEGFATRIRGVLGTGCRAKIVIRDRLLRGMWTVDEVHLEHNHELQPDCVRLMRCHRAIPCFVKRQLEINELAGLAQNKSITAVFTQAGGVTHCSFTDRDMRNYIAEVRRLQLSKGDAAALMDYFRQQQDKSPYFYCSYDLDDDGRLKNVFWADARSRTAYKYFGDVITFDTTYLTNRYRMPFAVFVGVNHHGQSTLLGCALLSNEMTETFEWCFQSFLSCMHGKAPEALITDQCGAICGAVEEVFKGTRHRLCLWHILKKLPEKLAGVVEKDKAIHDICTTVYESTSTQDFESKWKDFMSNHQLGSNQKWFEDMYAIKDKWVPIYIMDKFWAGMSTTQRSESMNAFFDAYVNSRTSLKAFVHKYDLALHAKWEKETQEDYKCKAYLPKLVTDLAIEKQFAELYTLKMFYQFQREIKLLIACYCERVSNHEYVVNEISSSRQHTVQVDVLAADLKCSCMQFEFKGIVCRHILCVCKQIGIAVLPEKYILSRWRKDYLRTHMKQVVQELPVQRDMYAYNRTYSAINHIVLDMVEIASRSSNLYQYLITRMSLLKDEVIDISENEHIEVLTVSEDSDSSTPTVRDPHIVKSKGRPRSTRIKSGVERNSKKKKSKKKDTMKSQQTNHHSESDQATAHSVKTISAEEDGLSDCSATELLMHFQFATNSTT